MNRNFRKALALIERAGERNLPVLVGIDGRSGVGKSTFAAHLKAASRARLIEGDAFYAGGINLRNDTAQQRASACIDRPKLRSVLLDLKAGRASMYRAFDWEAFDGSLGPAIVVEPGEVVIVEGVYSCHHDLADLLDVKIKLEISETQRHQRLMKREGSIGPWDSQWHEAEDWYFSHALAAGHFDLLLR